MKVAVLMLSYERYDTLKQVLGHNMNNAGYPFDLFVWDNGSKDPRVSALIWQYMEHPNRFMGSDVNMGIAAPLNHLITEAYSRGYDAFHVMANDILEPDNWLADKVVHLKRIPESGMVSICPGPIPYHAWNKNDRPIYPGDVIGQFMISRQVWERLGGFTTQFGLYGPIDNDYNARCRAKGFVNYYIPGQSIHLGDDNPGYGYDKADQVEKTWPQHIENVKSYQADPGSAYIPVDGQSTINMNQFFNDKGTGAL